MPQKKADIIGSGYSDDCASFVPLKTTDSEYEVPHKWYTLLLGDDPVGRMRLHYNHGEWEVHLLGTKGKFSLRDDVPLQEQDERVRRRHSDSE